MTQETIQRLVYFSRNRGASSPEAMASNVRNILAASRRNNATVDVTGALMFNAGCFAQVLEGPRASVENTFERIQQDERHGEVSVLGFGSVTHRSFNRWSMGFVGEYSDNFLRYNAIIGDCGYDPSSMTGDALFETLHRLVLEEERAVG